MNSLQDIVYKESYKSTQDSVIDDFYLPCLSSSIKYDRAVGYFSSGIYNLIHVALSDFYKNGGKIRIICSPELNNADFEAVSQGVETDLSVTEKSLENDLRDFDEVFGQNVPSSLLKAFIEKGFVEIRFAVPTSGEGIYHPKLGIFQDSQGNSVSFNGSSNETFKAWYERGNFEFFEVFTTWKNDIDKSRVRNHMQVFEEIWLGLTPGLNIYEAKHLGKIFKPKNDDIPFEQCLELIKKKFHKNNSMLDFEQDLNSTQQKILKLEDHQKQVLEDWKENDTKGIVSFVTGGGKTIVGLAAAKYWLDKDKPVLIMVPTSVLHDQWQQEIKRELIPFGYRLVLLGNEAKKQIWKPIVQSVLGDSSDAEPIIFLSTYQTAKSDSFLKNVSNYNDLLVIADEAHKLGAIDSRKIMEQIQAPGRLALSATIKRYGDEEGTQVLYEYFKNELEPKFDFSEAIAANRLVPYEYDFIEIYLTPEEDEEFEILTKKMKACLSWANGVPSSTDASNHYARLRANIVKEAKNKDEKVINILKGINKNDRWLVYCNSLSHMNNLRDKLADQKIESTVYHSQINNDVKKATLNLFEREGGILLSIKCLDEGVDIPLLDHALIIASSGNPREYIQRRGRALRKAKGKYLAFLYDLVVLKQDGTPALIHEITRAQELASNSNNLMAQIKLRNFIEQWRKKNKIEEEEIEQIEEDEE